MSSNATPSFGARRPIVSPWKRWGPLVNNLNIWLAGLGRAASLRIACVARHTARSVPRIASQSSGPMFNLFPCRPWVMACSLGLLGLAAASAGAAPVVVGSVNPVTKRITVFEDLMVKTFADGTAIQHFHGGYSTPSKAYFLVRSGQAAKRGCHTEVFRLVRISGNRVAIADTANPMVAWNPKGILTNMYATFDCTSTDCMNCLTGDPVNDPLGADLDNPGCACEPNGVFTGTCNTSKPGLGGPYGPGALTTLPG
jgi:hypothetical protein